MQTRVATNQEERVNLRARGINNTHDAKVCKYENLDDFVTEIVYSSSSGYVYELAEKYEIDIDVQGVSELIWEIKQTIQNQYKATTPIEVCTKILRQPVKA